MEEVINFWKGTYLNNNNYYNNTIAPLHGYIFKTKLIYSKNAPSYALQSLFVDDKQYNYSHRSFQLIGFAQQFHYVGCANIRKEL